jgi:imidazolonepropionase-like amidohydrolase
MLLLPHDAFYGSLHLKRALPGVTCSHRLANSPPEEVELHTHIDAHLHDRSEIQPGRRADLVLVEGDPTQDISRSRRIVAIWKKGERVVR